LGDWIIRPRRGCIQRGDEIVHVHPKPMAVLQCLAAADGEVVKRDEMFKTVWPDSIVSDDALAQCIVELRKAFGDNARDSRIISTIPKVGFCLIPPVSRLTETQHVAGNKLRYIIPGMLAVVLALIALYRFTGFGEPSATPAAGPEGGVSIAVLPFINRSLQPGDEYFTDGFHDELLGRLARIPALRVISRTSVNQYRDTEKSLPEIARDLSVGNILEGSVQRDGRQIRINVQLIDARSDVHLWAKTYDSEQQNIFRIQDEISIAIATALQEQLGVGGPAAQHLPTTEVFEAHDAFLRGRYLLRRRTATDMEAAIVALEKAVALDPDYAIAHSELAMALILGSNNYFKLMPPGEALARAAEHINRAIALNADHAEAYAALGHLAWRNAELYDALEAFNRALRINPNYSEAHSWIALLSARLGRYSDILPHLEQALRLDPLSVLAMNNYVHDLIEKGRYDEATRELEKIKPISPRIYVDYQGRLKSAGGNWAWLALGSLDELLIIPGDLRARGLLSGRFLLIGLEQEALAINDTPDFFILLSLGRLSDAIAAAETRLAENPSSAPIVRGDLGRAFAAAGDYANARPLLEENWRLNGKRITMGLFGSEHAAALYAIRRDAGEEAEAAELLLAILDDVLRRREAGFTTTDYMSTDFEEGLFEYLSGNRGKGLALIGKASEDGYFIGPESAYLRQLYEDPGFAPIREKQQARQSRERQRFLDLVCFDNPYRDVWQPAEETCKQSVQATAEDQLVDGRSGSP